MSDGRPPAGEAPPPPPDEGPWPPEPPAPESPARAWPSRVEPGGVLPEEDDEEAPWPPPRPAEPEPGSEPPDETGAGAEDRPEGGAAAPPGSAADPPAPPAPSPGDGATPGPAPDRADAHVLDPAAPPTLDESPPAPPTHDDSPPSSAEDDDAPDDEEAPWPAHPSPAATSGPTPLRPLQPRRPRLDPTDELDDDPAWEDESEPLPTRDGRTPRPTGVSRRLTALVLGLAAILLYLGDAWWQSTAPGFAELVRIEHLPLPADLDPGAGDPALDLRLQGLTAYGQGRWQEAEQALSRAAPQLADRHPELGLYLASALLHQGRFEEAEVEALAAAGPGDLQGEAWWLAIQARLSLEPPDLAGCYELLDQLVDGRLARADDARRLRQALDERR